MEAGTDTHSVPATALVFPGETPTKVELQRYLDQFNDVAEEKGYGPMLHGGLPLAAHQYTQRSLDSLPELDSSAPGAAARSALREDLTCQNAQKSKQLEFMLLEYRNRIATVIAKSVRLKAGLKWRKLQSLYSYTTHSGYYDGIKMYRYLFAQLTTVTDADDSDKHERIIEQMRDNRLSDNCTGQGYSDMVNRLIRDHNPYLVSPYEDERLGRLIINFLPLELAAEGRALVREHEDKRSLSDATAVYESCLRVVKMAHRPAVISTAAPAAKLKVKTKRSATPAGVANAAMPGNGRRGANNFRPPYALPDGQLCSKGTCNFNHDVTTPRGPWYRDPRWGGPLPEMVVKNTQQLERIKNARAANAQRLGIVVVPINLATPALRNNDCNECGFGFGFGDEYGINQAVIQCVVAEGDKNMDAQGYFEEPSGTLDIAPNDMTPIVADDPSLAVHGDEDEFASPPSIYETPPRPTQATARPPVDAPRALAPQAFPRNWYAVVGGPFEGAHYGSYELDIKPMVEGYKSCRAYGRKRGVVDEETAKEHVRLMARSRTRSFASQPVATVPAASPSIASRSRL